MKQVIAILSPLLISLTANASICPTYYPSRLTNDEIVAKRIKDSAEKNFTITNCKIKVSSSINPNATIAGPPDTYHMATTVEGIQTTSIYACDATNSSGESLTSFIKIIRFEPISSPRGDGFSTASNESCVSPNIDATTVEFSSLAKKK